MVVGMMVKMVVDGGGGGVGDDTYRWARWCWQCRSTFSIVIVVETRFSDSESDFDFVSDSDRNNRNNLFNMLQRNTICYTCIIQ